MSELFVSGDELRRHIGELGARGKGISRMNVVLGVTNQGKSLLSSSTSAENEDGREERESLLRKERRLQATKEAYWENSLLSDFYSINMAAEGLLNVELNDDQVKAVFYLLPDTVFGLGVQWGFDDTGVRGEIWEFIEENSDKVKAAINGLNQ